MSHAPSPGVSGLSLYVPPFRVNLEDWCAWTGADWSKVSAVVGRSFRVPGRRESVYTMAANAVLSLIERYGIDPRRVGFLGFGTESSTDNAAGAVVLRGMVDQALEGTGRPRLARDVEVPEFKHACLGGVYALKAALRYVAVDGADRVAIVVSGDIAEYERGSTGEQTQGAGAVALLVERTPRLFEVDLHRSASSSAYRGPDFRKPFRRHFMEGYADGTARLHDFPVFNGRYSTACYTEATVAAAEALLDRLDVSDPGAFYGGLTAAFFHRPYHHMPRAGMAAMVVFGLARSEAGRQELRAVAEAAGVDLAAVLSEIDRRPDLFAEVLAGRHDADPFPQTSRLVRAFRKTPRHRELVTAKLELGADAMMDLGNLYTASLPAWLAAGFEEAASTGADLAGHELLAMGYGSGDAAEALLLRPVDGWRAAAARIGFAEALQGSVDLTQAQYEALHDGRQVELPELARGFVIDRIGDATDASFQDVGIEYYRYVGA